MSEGLVQAGADGDEAVQGGEGEDAADLGAGDREPDLPAFGLGSLVRGEQGVLFRVRASRRALGGPFSAVADGCYGRGASGGRAGCKGKGGAPAREPRRVLEGMGFGWMIPLLVLLPVRPGGARC